MLRKEMQADANDTNVLTVGEAVSSPREGNALLFPGLMPLEILNRLLVLLRGGLRLECSQISSLTGLWILFARVQPIPARF